MKVSLQLLTFVIIGLLFGLTGCQKPAQTHFVKLEGKTMGTSYHIQAEIAQGVSVKQLQDDIDKRLFEINKSMSTYDQTATIMQFNRAKVGEKIKIDNDFKQVFEDAKQVYQLSDGAFDPTVMPLVQLWGFGSKMTVDRLSSPPSADEIKQAKNLVDFNAISLVDDSLTKSKHGVGLDFSAIAKGYGVDAIAQVLQQQYQVNNFMVEIGGEVATLGNNGIGKRWQLGIDKPILNSDVKHRETMTIISNPKDGRLNLATSGNYRNSLVYQDVRYSHTIDPKTGIPIIGGADSVTVAHETTSLADAWATALTAMPYHRALSVAQQQNLAVLFIIQDETSDHPSSWQVVETSAMKQLRNSTHQP